MSDCPAEENARGGAGRAGAENRLLEAVSLSFAYDKTRTVFREISLSLGGGEIFALLGANGSGKSTLLSCLRGFSRPKTGAVFIKGKNIREMGAAETARAIGFIPQSAAVSRDFAAREYVALGRAPHIGFFAMPGKSEYEKADEVMESLGISGLAGKSCGALSGGELRQAQIARVLAQEPELILMDEPANHLDFGNQIKILKMILSLSLKGIAVLLTTHNPDHAILLDARTGILDMSGRLCSGSSGRIISEDNLRRIYREEIRVPFVPPLSRRVCAARLIK